MEVTQIKMDVFKVIWTIFALYLGFTGIVDWWTIILIATFGIEVNFVWNK